MSQNYDVIVIGAGAAGLMAAGTAALQGKKTAVIEKNDRPGKKILITGKGRCNVTNNCDVDTFISNVKVNGRFLYSAANALTPSDVMAFFQRLGVPLKTERGNRVFPVSDKAADIASALYRYAKEAGADYINGEVKEILSDANKISGVKLNGGETLYASAVVVATGGKSYPGTGSTGDGYKFASSLGHTVITPTPSLVPVETNEKWCRDAMGLSLKNVTLTVTDTEKNKKLFSQLGEMLFTHFGVSGPLVLSASSHMKQEKLKTYKLTIDLKPALTIEQLDKRIQRDFAENLNRNFINSLGALLPRKLIPVIVKLSGIEGETKVNQITRTQRLALCETIKGLTVTPKAFRPIEEAIITSGGVKISEINPKTMQSKLCGGLYFAGEVIDVDAYTGGFNLQVAFSTGYLAGISV